MLPVLVGVNWQLPVLDAPDAVRLELLQLSPVPSLTVTVPAGATAAPVAVLVTVKFTVTGWPTVPFAGFSELIAVEVVAALTLTFVAVEVSLEACVVSPE